MAGKPKENQRIQGMDPVIWMEKQGWLEHSMWQPKTITAQGGGIYDLRPENAEDAEEHY